MSDDIGDRGAAQDKRLALHDEEIAIVRRRVPRGTVGGGETPRRPPPLGRPPRTPQPGEVERIPINAFVDAAPPLREEGDVTILSVVEEVVVTERRLLLREEVRMRRVVTAETHAETVVLRTEEATIERIPASP